MQRLLDWRAFAERFADEAVMSFDALIGPFVGRRAIAAAYAARSPTDTILVIDVVSAGADDEVRFAWDAGGMVTRSIAWNSGGRVARLAIRS